MRLSDGQKAVSKTTNQRSIRCGRAYTRIAQWIERQATNLRLLRVQVSLRVLWRDDRAYDGICLESRRTEMLHRFESCSRRYMVRLTNGRSPAPKAGKPCGYGSSNLSRIVSWCIPEWKGRCLLNTCSERSCGFESRVHRYIPFAKRRRHGSSKPVFIGSNPIWDTYISVA